MNFLSFARLLLGMMLVINGIAMLTMPEPWYLAVPGVSHTGPLNAHFVRDIGAAYLVAGAAFVWLARDPARARAAALAGAAFLLLHAGVHIGETIAGTMHLHHLLGDLPTVFLTPVLAVWLARKHLSESTTKENRHVTMDRQAPARRV